MPNLFFNYYYYFIFFYFPNVYIQNYFKGFFLVWEIHKKLQALITPSGFSIQSTTTRKYPEIIDPLRKDEGNKVSDFQKSFCKPFLYTQRVYNNIVEIGEERICSSKAEKRSSSVLLAEASKRELIQKGKKNQTRNKGIKYTKKI